MQILAAFIATVVTVQSALDYVYEPERGGDEGECLFSGSISTGGNACKKYTITRSDFKQNVDLSWKMLTSACPELVMAGCADPSWGKDKNMNDLEWRPGCNGCPRCPCAQTASDIHYIKNYTQWTDPFEVKECWECSCSDWYDVNGNDVFAYDCRNTHEFSSPDALKEVRCPWTTPAPTPAPVGPVCDDNTGDQTYQTGQFFFYYDNDKCETYCLCNSTGGGDCATGWGNISANEDLKYDFLDTCGDLRLIGSNTEKVQLADAWDDPSRWITTDASNCEAIYYGVGDTMVYHRCPKVDCGTHAEGEEWSGLKWSKAVYKDNGDFDYALYDCVDCVCTGGIPVCTTYDTDERSIDGCSKASLACKYDQDYDGDVGHTDDTKGCAVSEGETYCGWINIQMIDGFDPDSVCVEENVEFGPYWDCFESSLCDAVFGYDALQASDTGICLYQEISWTAYTYDCLNYKWIDEIYTADVWAMCCKDNECNDQDPSSSALGEDNKCGSNSKYEEMLRVQNECERGSRGIKDNNLMKYLHCGKDLPEGEYGVCDLLMPYWDYGSRCECRQMQILEKFYPDDDHHKDLREELQLQFDNDYSGLKADLGKWNEEYDCGLTFECSIEDAVDSLSMSLMSVLFVFVLYYCL